MRSRSGLCLTGFVTAVLFLLLGCGSATKTFTIGGKVSGLAGSGLMLEENGNNITVQQNGSFSFPTAVPAGTSYKVSILTQPSKPTQICSLANGTGTATGNVTNVQVSCAAAWSWMSGSNEVDVAGIYGTLGVAAAQNTPGARISPVSWTDATGNLWLFGGLGFNPLNPLYLGDFNDLWEYSGGMWKWVGGSNQAEQAGVYGTKGQPASTNVPGARYEAVSWTDASGNFWLFGGIGLDSTGNRGPLDDLWEFSAGQWTWVNGSNLAAGSSLHAIYGTLGKPDAGNTPGPRSDSSSWADASGNLWLFGGEGNDSNGNTGLLNDLWKYSGGEWTWMSGSNTVGQYGVYGTQGTAAPDNVPGARASAVTWTDAAGNLWLFGGEGHDSTGALCAENGGLLPCVMNDLWEYSAGEWKWISGSEIIAQSGSYGSQGTPSLGNSPGARWEAFSWTDAAGDLWLFGGSGFDSTGSSGDLNDLWEFNGGQWTWMSGSNMVGELGTYGTLGEVGAGNLPGARETGANWIDKTGNLWLFGGAYFLTVSDFFVLNDLWEYQGWGTNGETPNRPGTPPQSYMIGGTVSGLTGTGLVLADDSSDSLTVNADGSFEFSTTLTAGSSYTVSVLMQPASQFCSVSNGSGTVTEAVTNVQVACTNTSGHNEWTWVSGSLAVDQLGTYGTRGSPAAGDVPGARVSASTWTDAGGNLWMFGGNAGSLQNGSIRQGGVIDLTYYDFNDLWKLSAGQWTWIGGSNTTNAIAGVYGSLGVASPGNQPGSRHGAVTWTDPAGNLWLFGGIGIDSTGTQGDLNDLWKYKSGAWTWMGGSQLTNQSGSYGTAGTSAASNFPGARDSAVGWTDTSGNLWLFGGFGYDSTGATCFNIINASCYLNDLWEYKTGQWTWMGGPNTANDPGSFGTEGFASASNYPSARQNASAWMDMAGNVWIFGGYGIDSSSNQNLLNDLWEYSQGRWTWVSGSQLGNAQGSYGTLGTPNTANAPGARMAAANWIDSAGNLWVFGGLGNDSANNYGPMNDLWEIRGGQWVWMGGNSVCCTVGTGSNIIMGAASSGSIPAPRYSSMEWTAPSGSFWLFGGGIGFQPNKPAANFSDLWMYQP